VRLNPAAVYSASDFVVNSTLLTNPHVKLAKPAAKPNRSHPEYIQACLYGAPLTVSEQFVSVVRVGLVHRVRFRNVALTTIESRIYLSWLPYTKDQEKARWRNFVNSRGHNVTLVGHSSAGAGELASYEISVLPVGAK
jgi:hypothetical protein